MSDGVDETFAGRSPYEERAIPEPPVLGREFERDFLAACVDDVAAKATFGHERRMPHRLTSTLEELTGTQRCWNEELFEETELPLREVPFAFKIRPQGNECRYAHRYSGRT